MIMGFGRTALTVWATRGEGDADPVVGAGERGWDDARFGGTGQFPVRHPPQQLLEQDADLEPGQVRAETQVGPCAESEVAVVRPGHVEHVRVGEYPRVTVGRPVQQENLIAGPDPLAVPVVSLRCSWCAGSSILIMDMSSRWPASGREPSDEE